MADTSTGYQKYMTKKTEELNDADLEHRMKKPIKKTKTKAGSYNKKKRRGYEDMLKKADDY